MLCVAEGTGSVCWDVRSTNTIIQLMQHQAAALMTGEAPAFLEAQKDQRETSPDRIACPSSQQVQ